MLLNVFLFFLLPVGEKCFKPRTDICLAQGTDFQIEVLLPGFSECQQVGWWVLVIVNSDGKL
jgi:hypothetical protein